MLHNIEMSKAYTSDFIRSQIQEKSRALENRIQAISSVKASGINLIPSWQERVHEESKFKQMIKSRLQKIKFKKLIRPTLISLQKTLVFFHFLRSLSIFYDLLSMQDDEILLSVHKSSQKPARNPQDDILNKARMQRDSNFNFAMLGRFRHSSEIRLVVNTITLAPIKQRIEMWTDRVSICSKLLTKFGRKVARRRVLDLCILVANFNKYMVSKYATRIKDSSTLTALAIPQTNSFLAKLPKLIPKIDHLSFTLHEKHRAISIELKPVTEDPSTTIFKMLDSLVKEIMPFSIHWTSLQFDRSYFVLKKTKLTEDLMKIDKKCKIDAISKLLDHRNIQLRHDIKTYWSIMDQYVRKHPKEINHKRTEYLLSQSCDHIDRMIECAKGMPDREQRTDNLPYQSKKRERIFAEQINWHLNRATLNYELTEEGIVCLLETYNKLLKTAFLKYTAQQLDARKKNPKNNTSEQDIEQAEIIPPDD